jgi:thymidylate kinase
MLVTFSGLDGAGKTTLIGMLAGALAAGGRRVTRYSMYENAGVFAAIRHVRRRWAHLGETGVPQPAFRSQAAQDWIHGPVMASVLLPFDAAFFRVQWRRVMRTTDVLIMDRYFYDSLVELRAQRRWWGSAVLATVPKPDLAVLVDVPAPVAFARKGEHDIPELTRRERDYRELFTRIANGIVIRNDSVESASRELLAAVVERLPRRPLAA